MNTKSEHSSRLFWACALALFLAFNLPAQTVTQSTNVTINCCFDEANEYGQQNGALVLGLPNDLWNFTWGASSLSTVFDTGGNLVPNVGISLSGGAYYQSTSGTAYDANTIGLMEAYYTKQNNTMTLNISGLTSYEGCPFTLVMYAAGNGAGQGSLLNITAGATGGTETGITIATTRKVSSGIGNAYTNLTGTITGSTLTITATNSGVSGGSGYTALNGFQLQISGVPATAPVISTQPQSVSVYSNNTAVFDVTTVSSSPVTFQWFTNGNPDTTLGTGSEYAWTDGASGESSGSIYCVVQNGSGSPVQSSTATLTTLTGNSNQLIDVQVAEAALQTGQAVLGFSSSDTWNPVEYDLGALLGTTIKNYTGTALSGVTVLSDDWSGKFSSTSGTTYDAATKNLMEGYLYESTGTPEAPLLETITGLAPYVGEYFEMVVYGAGNGAGQGGALKIIQGATGGNTANTLIDIATTRQISLGIGNAYNIFDGFLTNGTLMFTCTNNGLGSTYGTVNGFQLLLFSTNPPPIISLEPAASVNAIQGSTFTNLYVIAGSPTPMSYQWFTNGVAFGGQTGSSIDLSPVTAINASADYYVVVTNLYGATTSSVSSLSVVQTPVISPEPLFTNLNLLPGGGATLSIGAIGTAPLAYQWYSNNVAIGGATATNYTLSNVQLASPTNYFCVVSNSFGAVTSSVVNLTVVTPTGPYPQAVASGGPVGLWPLTEGPDNGQGNDGTTAYDIVGGNNGTYLNTTLAQPGYGTALASQYGYSPATDTNTAAQFGLYAAAVSYVTISNISLSEPAGSNAEFSVEAWVCVTNPASSAGAFVAKGFGNGGEEFVLDMGAAGNTAFRFWVRNAGGGTIYQANSSVVVKDGIWYHLAGVCDEANSNLLLYVDGTLAATGSIPTGAGIVNDDYWPMTIGARDAYTTGTQTYGRENDVALFKYALSASQIASNYFAAGVGPGITQEPIASTNIFLGQTLVVPATVTGTALSYQWYETNLIAQTGYPLPGQTSPALVISDVQTNDNYFLNVTNSFGSTNSTVVIVAVISSPVITAQFPITYTTSGTSPNTNYMDLYAGANPAFSVSAIGVPPLYYQWFTNGVGVAGATNRSFTETDVQISTNDTWCVVTNPLGATTSAIWSASVMADPTNSVGGRALYPQQVLALNPVAYWRLNDYLMEGDNGNGDDGYIAYDYAGGNDAIYTNVVLGNTGYNPTEDPADTAVAFGDGVPNSSDANDVGTNIDFSLPAGSNAEFSVECWVSFFNTNVCGLVTKGYGNGGEEFTIDCDTKGLPRFLLRVAGGTAYAAQTPGSELVTENTWYHLVGVCDEANSNLLFYVNGQLAATTTTPALYQGGILDDVPESLIIGARSSNQTNDQASDYNNQTDGYMNDVALFNYALSPLQIENEYVAGGGTNAPYFNPTPPTSGSAAPSSTLTIPVTALGTPPMGYWWTNVTTSAGIASGTVNNNVSGDVTLTYPSVPSSWNGDQLQLTVTNAYGSTNVLFTLSIANSVSTTPTNIVSTITNNVLYLTWPADHTGWQLQAQTNGVSKGIGTNWVNIIPSTTTNQVAIPINLTNGTVFYRLTY